MVLPVHYDAPKLKLSFRQLVRGAPKGCDPATNIATN